MDDLLGEDWQSSSNKPTSQPLNAASFASNYSSLRATPQPSSSAASSTPNLSRPSSTAPSGQRAATKTTNDAFGGLTGFKSKVNGTGLSIQERQRQLQEERQRQAQQQGALWDNLGSSTRTTPKPVDDEDDILAAFNKDVKVDRSSHFPPPSLPVSEPVSRKDTPSSTQPQTYGGFDDDDDTFGLSGLTKINGHSKQRPTTANDDDDILGDLSRPVLPKVVPTRQDSDDERWDENIAKSRSKAQPEDAALSELTDMGFPEDTARIALVENGRDVQRSVGWLLQQAHEESKQKAKEARGERRSPSRAGRSPARRQDESVPSWTRQEERSSSNGLTAQSSGDKDASQIAQEFGSKLFKSANSLWKAGQKQMAKTVADFQQERNASQPKWMQSEQSSRETSRPRPEQNGRADLTNEAALLDMPRDGPPRASRSNAQPVSRDKSPLPPRPRESARASPAPIFQDRRPASKLSRQEVEEQSAQAYVSPARRKAKAKPEPAPEPEVDLFSPMPSRPAAASVLQTSTPQSSRSPAPPVKARPRTTRSIPAVSPAAMATSAKHRERGTEAFKRGDYSTAHEAYGAALTPLPATHPLLIVILSNRSLTALKTGDAKTAVSDADRAIEIIGPGLGVDETIEVDNGVAKDMREFYGKAVMRKAEALEHMEKWSEAAVVWRLAVEAGAGGAVSIRGRDRCEKAANPAPKPAARPAPAKPMAKTAVRPTTTAPTSDVAVKKLREANAAADRADDEKFQLSDKVDARLTAWKGGKADNLRALLQSMDTVLWESAGWKKVGMSDLVMPNKVKIIYMKAIAKVHPDKLPQDASVEQRMISGAVFSTLNEAWDKFKKDNNL